MAAYASRQEALDGFDVQMPDLAVLDIILGDEVDAGFALCRELLTRNPTLPVIFLTERIKEVDKISGLRLGAWDYQSKPISLDYLAERISSLLRINEVRASDDSRGGRGSADRRSEPRSRCAVGVLAWRAHRPLRHRVSHARQAGTPATR